MNHETQEQKRYQKKVKEKMPKSHALTQCIRAFIVGGIICCIGQLVHDFAQLVVMLDEKGVSSFTSIVMIFFGATLTGIGVYDKIGAFAGAGSVVPITGFANSVVAAAIEYKKEGWVFGVGCKIFTIAGPVILYGIVSSWILGVIYWITKLL